MAPKVVDTGLEATAALVVVVVVVVIVPKGAAAVDLEASLTMIILDVGAFFFSLL